MTHKLTYATKSYWIQWIVTAAFSIFTFKHSVLVYCTSQLQELPEHVSIHCLQFFLIYLLLLLLTCSIIFYYTNMYYNYYFSFNIISIIYFLILIYCYIQMYFFILMFKSLVLLNGCTARFMAQTNAVNIGIIMMVLNFIIITSIF